MADGGGEVKAPDYMDWVIGWKGMNVGAKGLTGSVLHRVMPPGEVQARHGAEQEMGCPHEHDHCGFNAFYEYSDAMRTNAILRGRGERFAIHPDGWRAEWAEVIGLLLPNPLGRSMDDPILSSKVHEQYLEVAKQYEIPLFRNHTEAEIFLFEHPEIGSYFPVEKRPPFVSMANSVTLTFHGAKPIPRPTLSLPPEEVSPAWTGEEIGDRTEYLFDRLTFLTVILIIGVVFGVGYGIFS